MSPNNQRALDIMKETVQLKNSDFEIAVPWKMYPPNLERLAHGRKITPEKLTARTGPLGNH